MDLDLAKFGASALTDPEIAVPEGPDDGIPVTYVPARNTVFLSIALALAEARDIHDICIGVNGDRLFGLSGLSGRIHIGIRDDGQSGDPGRRGGTLIPYPHAADRLDQGRDHPRRGAVGSRLCDDCFVLPGRF